MYNARDNESMIIQLANDKFPWPNEWYSQFNNMCSFHCLQKTNYVLSIGIEGVFVAQDQCLTTTLPKYSRVWYSSVLSQFKDTSCPLLLLSEELSIFMLGGAILIIQE